MSIYVTFSMLAKIYDSDKLMKIFIELIKDFRRSMCTDMRLASTTRCSQCPPRNFVPHQITQNLQIESVVIFCCRNMAQWVLWGKWSPNHDFWRGWGTRLGILEYEDFLFLKAPVLIIDVAVIGNTYFIEEPNTSHIDFVIIHLW